jgi:hypothetical protein
MKQERLVKPWWSIGTLLVVCAAMAAKINHVSFRIPEIAWWGWPLLLVAGIALNVGFFVWLAMITTENRKVEGAEHLQVAALVVFLLLFL